MDTQKFELSDTELSCEELDRVSGGAIKQELGAIGGGYVEPDYADGAADAARLIQRRNPSTRMGGTRPPQLAASLAGLPLPDSRKAAGESGSCGLLVAGRSPPASRRVRAGRFRPLVA
jgi:hypothetical protein